MIDVNHWYNPNSAKGREMRKKVEAKGKYFTFEVYCTFNSIRLLADAFERAGTTDPDAVNAALATSTLDPLMMPYGPTKMVNGQNMGGLWKTKAVTIHVGSNTLILGESDSPFRYRLEVSEG